jgi:Zn finger protein HypA/HybF involved in hydrogenase expression
MKFHVTVTSKRVDAYGMTVDANSEAEAANKVNEAIATAPQTIEHIYTLVIGGQQVDVSYEDLIEEGKIVDTVATPIESLPTELKCPKCGNTEDFRYLETVKIVTVRAVGEIDDGVLEIDAAPEYDTDATRVGEGGQYPRLYCPNCDECFPVPAGLKLDFVKMVFEDEE